MKKIFSILVLFLAVTLVGCSQSKTTTKPTTQNSSDVTLNNDQSLALSAYLAGSMLSLNNSTSPVSFNSDVYLPQFMADSTNTNSGFKIDTTLDEVNVYFDMLKAFMDNGVSSTLTITEEASTVEGYDTQVSYTIDGVTYTIYYSIITDTPTDNPTETTADTSTTEPTETTADTATTEPTETTTDTVTTEPAETTTDAVTTQPAVTTLDEDNDVTDTNTEDTEVENIEDHQEFELIGLMVIDGVEYQLQGKSVVEDNETKMWFETVDTNNTGNSVRVEIKNLDGQQQFEIYSDINGVEKSSVVKFKQEENLTKIDLKLNDGTVESSYKFMKVVEDGKTLYKLDYQIGDTKGQVKIFEFTDENGVVTYKYQITEAGRNKEVEKEKGQHGSHNRENGHV